MCVRAWLCFPPPPLPLGFLFLSSLRAGLAPPAASSPSIIEETAARVRSNHINTPRPTLFCSPCSPSGCWEGGSRGADTRQERAHDPVPRAGPGTGTPGSPAESALHKQMARASLSRSLVGSPSGSQLLGCLADAITILSEPQDPEPLIVAERVRGPGAPEQMQGTVSSLLGSTPQLQREDGARAEVTGMWR